MTDDIRRALEEAWGFGLAHGIELIDRLLSDQGSSVCEDYAIRAGRGVAAIEAGV